MDTLTFDLLSTAVAEAAAFRARVTLQPAGGPGDKVFPPTYATGDKAETKYAVERRRVGDQEVPTVLLDSVASQANRMEEALLEAWDAGELHFPVIAVDFSAEEGLADIGRLTTLQAPHRVADALLRDAEDASGTRFRDTAVGRAVFESRPAAATGMFLHCPHALVFGVWDSTGDRGGLGHKFQRALVSEIVGFGEVRGVKTASRMDPVGIQRTPVFHHAADHDDWTTDPEQAEKDKKGNPTPFARKGGEGKGNPSAVNHGNVAPSLEAKAGGVTLTHAEQTTVLSLAALRRLRFPTDAVGQPLGERRREVEHAARTALAALALAAVVYQAHRGYDLRSRCLLVPQDEALELEVVPAWGGSTTTVRLDRAGAAALVAEAGSRAAALGLAWEREPLALKPLPKLADLIRRSRAEATPADDETA